MKKVQIDYKNLCINMVDMDDVDKNLYLNNSIETNTISDFNTALEVQRLIEKKGYRQI